MRRAASVMILLALLATTSAAYGFPALLREGTHPMWASLAFGPAAKISTTSTQFKLIQTFGYHFSGRADGPAIAIDIQEAFGNDFVSIEILPKFVWDIRLVQGLGVYLSPYLGLGFVAALPDCPAGYECPSTKGVTFQLGLEGKITFADRGFAFFRPIGIDVLGGKNGDWDTGARWDIMFGGGVIF